METKKIVILGAMLLLGGAVFFGMQSLNTVQTVEPTQAPVLQVQQVEYTDVLTVSEDVSTGQRITADMLTKIQWPTEALNASLVNLDEDSSALDEFANSIALQPVAQDEPLTRNKVIMAGDSGIMAARLAPGMRAVTTRISVDTAAGGFIQPGDRVDIILRENFTVRRDASQGQQGGAERNSLFLAQTLFENVKVLAIDQTFTTGPESGAAIPGSTATFELSQPDSELLQEAEGYGDIYLTLRGVTGSGYKGRSRARAEREEPVNTEPSSITIYRNGQPTPVALQQRN